MKKIAVALGEHPYATAALRWAGELSKLSDVPLRVLSVYESAFAHVASDLHHSMVADRRTQIEAILAELNHTDASIDVLVDTEKDPIGVLADTVVPDDTSLVVIGARDSHGHGGLGSGHVAQHLLHLVDIPVAAIRPGSKPLDGGLIVVGVDGSHANTIALQNAEQLAVSCGGTLHAVFAYDPIDDTFVHEEGWHRHSDEVRAAVDKVTAVPIKLYMAAGHPAKVLINHADQENASAIVTGTRGRGGFSGLRLGRVPNQLIAHATCPVMVVPH